MYNIFIFIIENYNKQCIEYTIFKRDIEYINRKRNICLKHNLFLIDGLPTAHITKELLAKLSKKEFLFKRFLRNLQIKFYESSLIFLGTKEIPENLWFSVFFSRSKHPCCSFLNATVCLSAKIDMSSSSKVNFSLVFLSLQKEIRTKFEPHSGLRIPFSVASRFFSSSPDDNRSHRELSPIYISLTLDTLPLPV